MATKRIRKIFQKIVTKCMDCPNCVDEPDWDPTNGWWRCTKQSAGKRLDGQAINTSIDADCPLRDAPEERLVLSAGRKFRPNTNRSQEKLA